MAGSHNLGLPEIHGLCPALAVREMVRPEAICYDSMQYWMLNEGAGLPQAEMILPNAERAFLDIRKLRDYTLNPRHLAGGNKARVFASCLGIGPQDAELLRSACLHAILANEAIEKVADSHGQRYQVDFVMQHQGKSATIRTGWIIRTGEEVPRLTSCYVRTP